jgi:hypothetical protein
MRMVRKWRRWLANAEKHFFSRIPRPWKKGPALLRYRPGIWAIWNWMVYIPFTQQKIRYESVFQKRWLGKNENWTSLCWWGKIEENGICAGIDPTWHIKLSLSWFTQGKRWHFSCLMDCRQFPADQAREQRRSTRYARDLQRRCRLHVHLFIPWNSVYPDERTPKGPALILCIDIHAQKRRCRASITDARSRPWERQVIPFSTLDRTKRR